jgi:CheY-like chemotaxis protein
VRILVAEDDRSSRRLITAMLARLGWRTDLALDGIEAVDAVKLMRYDLVLMDLNMPKLDGLQAVDAIRRMGGKHAATPIVVLTGDGFADTEARCRAAGADAVLLKPIAEEALIQAVQAWTGKPPRQPPAAAASGASQLAERLGPKVFAEMVAHFREDGPRYLAELAAALAAGRLAEAASQAHRLAGAAKAFALAPLAASAHEVEVACSKDDRLAAERHAAAAATALDRSLALLEAKLAPLAAEDRLGGAQR